MIALIIVLAGLLLLIAVPLIQRFLDRSAREHLMVFGLVLEVLGLVLSVWMDRALTAASLIAFFVLGWAILMYVIFRIRIARTPLLERLSALEHCASTLTQGSYTSIPPPPNNWKLEWSNSSSIGYQFTCVPTASSLDERLIARGHNYYVIWTSHYKVDLRRTITIQCELKSGRCAMKKVSAVGPKMGQDRALIGQIGEEIEYTNGSVTIIVAMGVALDAADVTVTAKASKAGVGGSVTIKFPKASREVECDMGTYEWKCVGKSVLVSSTTPSAGGSMGSGSRETDEGDCGFDQEFTLVGHGPKDGEIKFSWSIYVSGQLVKQGDGSSPLDEKGHTHEDFNFDVIVVPGRCENEFTYEARFEFEVLDENGATVDSGTASVDTFIKDCDEAEDRTLDFALEMDNTTVDGFLQLKDFECV